ncbi:hypothetical protein FRC17_005106 [Serendipita sp. 399]|nr:hypothetical protein FRC17_005106 [Serendipita sp. 399]
MSTPPADSPLSDLAASATELSDFLDNLGVSPSASKPRKTRKLVLPQGPKPEARLRKLHLPNESVEKISEVYNTQIQCFRDAILQEHETISQASPKAAAQIGKGLKQMFKSTTKFMCDNVIESATDALDLMIQQKPERAPQHRPPFNKAFTPVFEYISSHHSGYSPSRAEKQFLARCTKMSVKQISTWFQNRRARFRKKVREGKPLPKPPSLEETLTTLRGIMEKQNTSDPKVHKTITFKRKKTYFIIEDDELPEPNSKELYEMKIRMQYQTGILPNLDYLEVPEGSFPDPFEQPLYDPDFWFPTPIWDRDPSCPTNAPAVAQTQPVTEDEMEDLLSKFANLELYRQQEVIEKRKVTFLLPLPPTIQEALKKRKQLKKKRKVARQEANWRKVQRMQEEDDEIFGQLFEQPQPVTDDTNTQPQVQIEPEMVAKRRSQIIPRLCEKISGLFIRKPKKRLPVISLETNEQEGEETDEEDDNDTSAGSSRAPSASSSSESLPLVQEKKELVIPIDPIKLLPTLNSSITSSYITSGNAATDPETFMAKDEWVDNPLLIDIQLDDQMLNQALRMTLRDMGWEGTIPPCTLFDPITHSTSANVSAGSGEPILEQLLEATAHLNTDLTLPDTAHTSTDYEPGIFVDPARSLVPTQSTPSSWDRDAAIAWAQANYPDVSADTYVGPTLRLYDPLGPSLPFPLSDLNDKPEHFDHPMPSALYEWEPTHPTSLFTFEGKPIPEHDPNLKWETIINYLEKLIQKDQRREIRWAKRQRWPISSVDPRSMLQYLNL